MSSHKLYKMALAAASLAMVTSTANAIPESPLGDLSAWADELPYEVLDWFSGGDGADGGWYREAPGDGDPDVVGGSDDGEGDSPKISTEG